MANKSELYQWGKPFLHDDGRVYVHIGYGEWQLFDPTDEFAQYALKDFQDGRYRKTQRERLEAFLVEQQKES